MKIINHINLDEMSKTIERAKTNPEEAKKTVAIEGEWFSQATSGPQFSASLPTEQGEFTISSDEPTFLGGTGSKPNPIQYCVYGAASCFAATFAKWAAFEGVVLKTFKIKATANMDLSRAFGLSQAPVLKELILDIFVKTDADDEKLARVEKISYERCPAVYCLFSSIPVKTNVTKL